MISVLQLCDCVPKCVRGCLRVGYIFLVWLCDNQNEASQQGRPGKRSILLADVCGRNPPSSCVENWWGRAWGVGVRAQQTPTPPNAVLLCLFYDT